MVLHSGSTNVAEATRIQTLLARLVATFNLLGLKRNDIPLGASATDDAVIL
jgi:hypothetical protein